MKKNATVCSALAVTLVLTVGVRVCALAEVLNGNKYYTWGISGDQVTISDGSIITEAELTIHGLTSTDENASDTLAIYVLDNPPLGFISNVAAAGVDIFSRHGFRLVPDYHDSGDSGTEDLTYRFSSINDPDSWIWKIFEHPFKFELADSTSVDFTSSLLELIDYTGNGTSFGIGLDPDGTNDFSFRGIALELPIHAFEGDPNESVLTYSYGDTNRPPVMQDIPFVVDIKEGRLLTFPIIATDPDDDELTYSVIRLPDGASLQSGIFKWIPPYDLTTQNNALKETVTFIASDGKLEDSKTVQITVINTNRNPILNPIGNKTVSENEKLSFSVSGTDLDGDEVEFTIPLLPKGAIFENNTFSWTPEFDQARAQSYSFLVVAVDKQQASDSETVRITVNNTNRPPVMGNIPLMVEIEGGRLITFSIIATDPDDDELTYSVTELPEDASFVDGVFEWTPSSVLTKKNTSYYEIVTFTASDGNLKDSKTVIFAVINTY